MTTECHADSFFYFYSFFDIRMINVALVLCLAQPPAADLPLAFDHSFAGGAVIQRDVTTEVWGTAPAGIKTVSIKINLNTAVDGVRVDQAGCWVAQLPAHPASYGCTLTVIADSTPRP